VFKRSEVKRDFDDDN